MSIRDPSETGAMIVFDLGPGDGGKGGVVHKLVTNFGAHTVIKCGGAQGSHGVLTSRGEGFAFSQFGCGTFDHAKTHISNLFIASPTALLNEANDLRYRHGIYNPFDLITVDGDAICATPFHRISSCLKELARKDNPRGTVGTGVGEVYRYSMHSPCLTIRFRDLTNPGLRDKLLMIREAIAKDIQPVIESGFMTEDKEIASEEINKLKDDDFLKYVIDRMSLVGKMTRVVDQDFLASVLSREGLVVIETSHGVLTDNRFGFHPHTSAIRTLPSFIHKMLRDVGFLGNIFNIGVTRAYQVRHGAGPMPTADDTMLKNLIPGSHKDTNRYQGSVRVGPLDLVMLRYAMDVCGGPESIDAIAITWFDQIIKNGSWRLCNSYQPGLSPEFFNSPNRINVGDDDLKYREGLTKEIFGAKPEIQDIRINNFDQDSIFDLCSDVMSRLGSRVRMLSFGPTENDKVMR